MSARMNYLLLSSLLQLSFAHFVFEFKVVNIITSVTDCGDFLAPACETYLNKFCLRERGYSHSSGDTDCPLGSSERFDPGDAGASLPVTRQIVSEDSWPVSGIP